MSLPNGLIFVLFSLWVCLLNRSSGLPLTFEPTQSTTHANLESVHASSEPTNDTRHPSRFFANLSNDEGNPLKEIEANLARLPERPDIYTADDPVVEKSSENTNELINDSNILNSNLSQHGNPNIIVLQNNDGPLILKGENKSNIYVLAHVLDMEKGLYYIPANKSENSTEAWVFWKIPHLYKLGNPPLDNTDDVTASESESDSNHGFYVLMLGLGCFICGLMIMLILTLVILTKRFSNRTRPTGRSFDNHPIVEADPNAPKYGERLEHPYYCENMDFYSMPYGPEMNRLRRFSSDDAIDILRRRAEPPLPPHYCACQRCCYNDVILTPQDDDDVPLIDPNSEPNDLCCSNNHNNNTLPKSNNTNEPSSLVEFTDTNLGTEHFLLATRTGNRPIEDATELNNDVSNNAPRSTSKQSEDDLNKNSRNVKDGTVYINRCDNRCHPFTSQPWRELSVADGRSLAESLQERCCESDELKLTTISAIDAISGAADSSPEQKQGPEKSPCDVTNPAHDTLNKWSFNSNNKLDENEFEVFPLTDNTS